MKRKMAFVDLTNFKDWPMGGMLEYELAILPYLAEYYDLDIWGYSLNGVIPMPLVLNGKNILSMYVVIVQQIVESYLIFGEDCPSLNISHIS